MAPHDDAVIEKAPVGPRLLGRIYAAASDVKQGVHGATGEAAKSLRSLVSPQPPQSSEQSGFDLADALEQGLAPSRSGMPAPQEEDVERATLAKAGSREDGDPLPFEGCFGYY